jgi:hypothetical protein
MAVETNGHRITRDDLQSAFSKAIGESEQTVRDHLPPVLIVAGAVALGVITVAFVLGRRGGRNESAVVEIRRL